MRTDRRVQRTRDLLQQALIDLIGEQGYDAITIQEIVDRANVGRTTFYVHYRSKDDLFMRCHESIASGFHRLHSLSREELLSPETPVEMIATYQQLLSVRAMLYPIFQGSDSVLLLRRIRDRSARHIEVSLRTAFADADSAIPFDVLANYLAGAQIALVHWWLEKHQPHTPETLAQTCHRLQRAAIRAALGLRDGA